MASSPREPPSLFASNLGIPRDIAAAVGIGLAAAELRALDVQKAERGALP
jgi:hypothetical protein